MKNLKKQYKDTFDNIKLDDKKINENLYKIIRKDNRKKTTKRLSLAIVNSIAIVFILIISVVNVVAHIDDIEKFIIKDNKKIEYQLPTLEKTFNIDMFYDNQTISLKDFTEKTGIKLLKPKGSTIDLKIWISEKSNNLTTWYEFDKSGFYSKDNFYVFAFRAYLNFDGTSDSIYECMNDDCAGSIKKLLLDGKTEVLIDTRSGSGVIVRFFFDNVLYAFHYHEYRLQDKIKSDETSKQVYDNVLDFISSLEY